MSYILDALKKSEQERQKAAGPTLQTIHRPLFVDSRKGGIFWGMLVLCIALTVALVLTSWRYFWQDKISAGDVLLTSDVSPALPESEPGAVPAQPLQTPGNAQTLSNDNSAETDFEVFSPRQGSQDTMDQIQPVVEFQQLPDPVQKQIPALTFSFHVYSENPQRRTIIINNRRVKEGDRVTDGLMLEQITAEGVVLNWQRFRFSINVVEQW